MERLKIDIIGIGEMRWPGSGEMTTEKSRKVIYSGGDTANRGVGIIMENDIYKKLRGYWPISDRIIMMKLQGKAFNINIIQVYAPTEDSTEEELEDFYEELTRIREQCKNHDVNIVMGDMNAKVGNKRHEDIVGQDGLGEKNTRGQKLIDWCTQHQQVITNTWFRHYPRRLWTWRSPGDRNRNQVDYITINRRFRNAIHQAKTYPGADCNSDHNLLVATVEIKMKKVITTKITARRQIDMLKNNREIKNTFVLETTNRYEVLSMEDENEDAQQQWNNLQISIEKSTEEIPTIKEKKNQPWMTEDIFEIMDKRRKLKSKDEEKYREYNRKMHRECRKAK